MEISKIFLALFFLFCTTMTQSADHCRPTTAFMCRVNDGPIIQFPFSLPSSCAYPGFNISCNEMNSAVIQVGSWGEFSARDVNYMFQEVQIHDQDNCLPKRLLSLDLSGSPFKGARYENFTFFNCSSDFSSNNSKPIGCLSSLNHTVYAISELDPEKEMIRSCELIKSVMVPSRSRRYQTDINSDIHLTWDTPDCRACARRYGNCGFKNRESSEITCFFPLFPERGLSNGAKYIIAIGVGIPAIICLFMIARSAAGRFTRLRHVEPSPLAMQQHPVIFMVGLDESAIQSYPRTVLGESRRLVNPEDSACSICLSEYQPKETLKNIPECKHCFHATCIDEWLRKNATCPICRNSLTPLPSSSTSP